MIIFKTIAKMILLKLADSDFDFEFSNNKCKNSAAFQISVWFADNYLYLTEYKNKLTYQSYIYGKIPINNELDISDPNLSKNIDKLLKKLKPK